jgi:hypothetical protein
MALTFLCFVAALLAGPALAQPERLNIAETEEAVRVLSAWFESEHGDPADLTPLVQLGEIVVPSLVATLEQGPSPARRERLRRTLDADYAKFAERVSKPPSKEAFVAHYMGNVDAIYRARAARALAAIGGAQARTALQGVLSKPMREDLRAAIERSLKTFK